MATTSDILTASAGNWTLVPDRSKVTFKNKTLWGLATVTGHFTEFRGEGSAGRGQRPRGDRGAVGAQRDPQEG